MDAAVAEPVACSGALHHCARVVDPAVSVRGREISSSAQGAEFWTRVLSCCPCTKYTNMSGGFEVYYDGRFILFSSRGWDGGGGERAKLR